MTITTSLSAPSRCQRESNADLASIAMIGVDYRSAPIAVREALAVPDHELSTVLEQLGERVDEAFILSTCNRTEIYVCLDHPAPGEALRAFLAASRCVPQAEIESVTTVRSGREALTQLFEVSTGLNSMMIGEPHILSQVRAALDAARDTGAIGPILSRAGAAALRVGKRARTETGITRNGHSIPHAATEQIIAHLDAPDRCSVVIIGAGQMAGHTARLLHSAGVGEIVVLNRSPLRGEALAHAVGGRSGPLDALPAEIATADALVSAVAMPDGFIVDGATLPAGASQSGKPLLAIDLGVPRTIDPLLGQHPSVRLVDIDDLGHAPTGAPPTRAADLDAMARMIDEETDRFIAWLDERAAAATIASLRDHAEQIRRRELDRALRRLGTLSERDREVVAALSVGLVGKLLHEPMVRLREDQETLDTPLRQLFGLENQASSPSSSTGE